MAGNPSRPALAVATRLLSVFAPSLSVVSAPSLTLSRRCMHGSVYDKNIDDQVCPTVVPDDMISPLSEKYWAPNPHTGVFGPPLVAKTDGNGSGQTGFYTPHLNGDGSESALEQKAFFRPVEDLDLPELPN